MKNKNILIGTTSLAALMLLCGCETQNNINVNIESTGSNVTENANVNMNENETTDTTEALNPDDFVGSWSSVRPVIDVTKEANNTYKFLVNWSSSAVEHTEWNYTCNFDEEKEIMECIGTKTNVTYTDEENYTSEVVGEDQEAEFSIKDGKLLWNEKVDNQAADIEIDKD